MNGGKRALAALTGTRILRYLQRSRAGLFVRELLRRLPPHVSLYLVGGTVRDFAEGAASTRDIDLMAEGFGYEELGSVLSRMRRDGAGELRRLDPQGERFGVYKIGLAGFRTDIDIALAREEVSTGHGHRDFIVHMDGVGAREDSSRRDFTINAIFFRLSAGPKGALAGEVVDFQDGLASLVRREIRAVGDPCRRFHEDPLRMLRALRQKNERDGFIIEEETWSALKALIPRLIHTVPVERIVAELLRMLGGNPVGAIRDWKESGALSSILPEVDALEPGAWETLLRRFAVLSRFLGRRRPTPTLLLACLLVDIATAECSEKTGYADYAGTGGKRFLRTFREMSFYSLESPGVIARRLAFPGVQDIAQMLNDLVRLLHYKTLNNRRAVAERILTRTSHSGELLALYQAHQKACVQKKVDFDFLLDKFSDTARNLDGNDILQMGIRPGAHLQMIMDSVREEELWDRLRTKEEAVSFALTLFHEEFEALNRHLSLLETLVVERRDELEPRAFIELIGRRMGTEILQLFHSNTMRLLDSYRERNLLPWTFPELEEAVRCVPSLYSETMKGLDLLLREEDEVSPAALYAFTLKEVGRHRESESMRRHASRSAGCAARFLRRLGAHPGLVDDVIFLVSNLWMFLSPRHEEMVKSVVESTRDDLITHALLIAHYTLCARDGRGASDSVHFLAAVRRRRSLWRMEYLRCREEQRHRELLLSEEELARPRGEGGLDLAPGRRAAELLRLLSVAQAKGQVKSREGALEYLAGLLQSYDEWELAT